MDSRTTIWRGKTDGANRNGYALGCLLALVFAAGCASSDGRTSRAPLAADLQERTCHDIPAESCPCELTLPPEVVLEDGLSEEEAVAIALWNNALFHSTLSQLGMARGDVVQAGLLTNPQFFYLFGSGNKQIEYVLYLPIEAMFFREQRITIAERDYCRISEGLVQNGLDLVRDVRVAYADLVFAIDRSSLAEEALRVRTNIADLSEKRLESGDIGGLEATTARVDALNAEADAAGMREGIAIARAKLSNLLGIGLLDVELVPSDRRQAAPIEHDVDVLLTDALLSRPDLRAAQCAIAATDQQARLARWTWFRFDAVADGNAGGGGATNFGPGIRFDVPIFNRNQGGIIRSDWTRDQAMHNFDAVRDRIVMEVRTAAAQHRQAEVSLAILQNEVLPSLRGAVAVAENAYRNGGETYFLTLQTTSQYLDSRARELDLTAAEHRALAELERSVGRRLVLPVSGIPPADIESDSIDRSPPQSDTRPLLNDGVAVAPNIYYTYSTGSNEQLLSPPGWHATNDIGSNGELDLRRRHASNAAGLDCFTSRDPVWPREGQWVAIDPTGHLVVAGPDAAHRLSARQ